MNSHLQQLPTFHVVFKELRYYYITFRGVFVADTV